MSSVSHFESPQLFKQCLEDKAMSLFLSAKPPMVQKVSRIEGAISSNQ